MKSYRIHKFAGAVAVMGLLAAASQAEANSINQNVAWTIDRPDSETQYRVVAYGDSIFAGYKGAISEVAIWAAPSVDGEYLSHLWGTDVKIFRRTKSGAIAKEIYEDKIVDEVRYMEAPYTRVIALEMCGNDGLRARRNIRDQQGTCDFSVLDDALANCTTYLEQAMIFINEHANPATKLKVISNLYYPGYEEDDVYTTCTDADTGQPVNKQDNFLPVLLRMNWRMCNFANQYGWKCADSFAQFMGADYDSNGDGKKDSRALRYRQGESEDAYVTRLGTTLRDTIHDLNTHFVSSQRSYDYILSDNVHPTYRGGTVNLGLLGGSGKGTSAPRFADDRYHFGRNPIWKKYGHERMGWALSNYNPPAP